MFGYVIANPTSLSEEQMVVYRAHYCGLCRCIGERYGSAKRIVLSYDLTFLTLLLSSLYDLDEQVRERRCCIHPAKCHHEIITDATEYAAAMNIALAYYDRRDDWKDENNLLSLGLSAMLQRSIPDIAIKQKDKLDAISDCLAQLTEIEKQNIQEPDVGAQIFGRLLGEIFMWKQDRWSELLRSFGSALGAFIYLTDAVLDLPKDIKGKSYNPLRSRWSAEFSKEDYVPILKIMLGECTDALERLPLIQHIDLLRNILYEGVWIRFYRSDRRPHKEEPHV